MRISLCNKHSISTAKATIFALLFCLVVCSTSPTKPTAANSPELIEQGAQAINQTKVGDAAQAAGKIVGAGVAEMVVGKGVGAAFKGLSALSKTESVGLLIAKVTSTAKETIGNVPLSTAATVTEIALTNGNKVKLLVVETKKLAEGCNT